MKVKLKEFPNGCLVVYNNVEYKKTASKLKDHFCLVCMDVNNPYCVYLHRDTYVEPIVSATKL